MRYLIEYAHGENIHDTKQSTVIVEAELSDDPDYNEENRVFKPLILQKTGHHGIKIMNYKRLD